LNSRIFGHEAEFGAMDDGADLFRNPPKRKDLLKHIYAGTEETTTGVIRLKSLEKRIIC